jgi:hypothetical protein
LKTREIFLVFFPKTQIYKRTTNTPAEWDQHDCKQNQKPEEKLSHIKIILNLINIDFPDRQTKLISTTAKKINFYCVQSGKIPERKKLDEENDSV